MPDNYRIFETDEFIKQLSLLPQKDRNLINNKLKTYIYPLLKVEPHFGNNIKKMINYNPPTWQYRIGKYRIFFVINEKDKVVSIITIDHRKNIYR